MDFNLITDMTNLEIDDGPMYMDDATFSENSGKDQVDYLEMQGEDEEN